ncbi:lysoplasmalogenase [Vibrio sp. 404]|uniref:Lysoplasmalogenase n=1 Tax=Vibrio marinisediminis TaxID=2758441 RepID=A0A7W2IUV7_9VIBR|nr:lysoplasmalogenase [Vibrio marinisediminis]MBA5763975.1 lysoplasmalogenase [Vibrio marinisediminis]
MWLVIAALCLVHIYSISHGPRWLFYLTKPLPAALLAVMVFLTPPTQPSDYGLYIGLGLAISVIGDIFLMLPKDCFRAGLFSFLVAQFTFGYAFLQKIESYQPTWLPILFACVGLIVYLLLLPSIGKDKWYVGLYFVSILFMASNATVAWISSGGPIAGMAMIGAYIFIMSDLVLAIDRFRASSAFSRHVVMFTYYTAQALFALSVLWAS